MKRLIRHLIALLAFLGAGGLTSCVDEASFDDTPEGNFEALWTAIDEHYCFMTYKGVDWQAAHETYRRRLSPKMSAEQLQEVMTDMLSLLKDGHVNLYTSRDISRYWHWYEDYPKNLDTELRDLYLGHDYRMAAGLKYRILPDNVGYIVCESFMTGIGEGNLDEALHYLRSCTGLIIDVRGNAGGSLVYAERFARRFTNERRLVGYIAHKTGKGHDAFSTPQPEYLDPSKGVRWQKRAIVLTNRECYSATNTFIRDMLCCPLVETLGDQTGGGSGMPFSSELPNGWALRISACPMYDRDMQHIEFGIPPTHPLALLASPTRDNLIEAAREILKQPHIQ